MRNRNKRRNNRRNKRRSKEEEQDQEQEEGVEEEEHDQEETVGIWRGNGWRLWRRLWAPFVPRPAVPVPHVSVGSESVYLPSYLQDIGRTGG